MISTDTGCDALMMIIMITKRNARILYIMPGNETKPGKNIKISNGKEFPLTFRSDLMINNSRTSHHDRLDSAVRI